MAKFSKKVMGKEIGDAAVYAEPHTMDGKSLKVIKSEVQIDPNTLSATESCTTARRISTGDPARNDVKTTGMKQRGHGAAIKGFTSRGPMG